MTNVAAAAQIARLAKQTTANHAQRYHLAEQLEGVARLARYDALRALVEEHRTQAAAARILGITPQAVAQQIAAADRLDAAVEIARKAQ